MKKDRTKEKPTRDGSTSDTDHPPKPGLWDPVTAKETTRDGSGGDTDHPPKSGLRMPATAEGINIPMPPVKVPRKREKDSDARSSIPNSD